MRARFCCCLFFLFNILGSVSSRQFPPSSDDAFPAATNKGTLKNPHSLQTTHMSSNQLSKEMKKIAGSRPPSCENKCYGCMPCEAIQVPTTSSRVGVQYTNYEPEGWKCKCGPTLYTP